MGCDGCIQKTRNKELDSARTSAKAEAKTRMKPIAIVLEEDQYNLYEAFFAYQNNMPVKEVVSHHE